jgi:hypothetical protein
MTTFAVWMPPVVHLETQRMLQVVPRLFVGESRHDGSTLSDVYKVKVMRFGQRADDFVDLLGSGYPMCFTAEVKLRKRADVTEFADADMPVVVG